jgi:hypothetical protein
MIMVNYVDLWLMHFPIASLLDGARFELRELKTHSRLLGACTSCYVLRSDLEAFTVEIKYLKHILDHASRYTVLTPQCVACGSVNGKFFHATKENTKLKQEVAYLIARLEKTVLTKKMIEEDLSRIEESATKSTYKLGVGFERCEDKGEKSAPKFIRSSTYHQEEKTIKSTKANYPSNPKSSFNPKREVRKETSKPREEAFVYMFCGCVDHLDEFCFRCKRIERRRLDYARNSYHDEFFEFHLALSLAFCLILLLVLYLMDLTIAHMILVYERTTLRLDTLVTAHVLIMVIIFRVGLVFLLEGLALTLS